MLSEVDLYANVARLVASARVGVDVTGASNAMEIETGKIAVEFVVAHTIAQPSGRPIQSIGVTEQIQAQRVQADGTTVVVQDATPLCTTICQVAAIGS